MRRHSDHAHGGDAIDNAFDRLPHEALAEFMQKQARFQSEIAGFTR